MLTFEARQLIREARSEWRRQIVKEDENVCEHCGSLFEPVPKRESVQVYCSKRCRDGAMYVRAKARRQRQRTAA